MKLLFKQHLRSNVSQDRLQVYNIHIYTKQMCHTRFQLSFLTLTNYVRWLCSTCHVNMPRMMENVWALAIMVRKRQKCSILIFGFGVKSWTHSVSYRWGVQRGWRWFSKFIIGLTQDRSGQKKLYGLNHITMDAILHYPL